MFSLMAFDAVQAVTDAFGIVGQAVTFIESNALLTLMAGLGIIPMGFRAFRSGKRSVK